MAARKAAATLEASAVYTALEPIQHDGIDYQPGDSVPLTDEQAEPLLLTGAISQQ